jgi:hypothetical protein
MQEVLNFSITMASTLLQFTISRNVRQSLSDNDNISEEIVGLSCVLHKNCVDGRWKNVCTHRLARAKWIDRKELRLSTPSYARTTTYERLESEVVGGCWACLRDLSATSPWVREGRAPTWMQYIRPFVRRERPRPVIPPPRDYPALFHRQGLSFSQPPPMSSAELKEITDAGND